MYLGSFDCVKPGKVIYYELNIVTFYALILKVHTPRT